MTNNEKKVFCFSNMCKSAVEKDDGVRGWKEGAHPWVGDGVGGAREEEEEKEGEKASGNTLSCTGRYKKKRQVFLFSSLVFFSFLLFVLCLEAIFHYFLNKKTKDSSGLFRCRYLDALFALFQSLSFLILNLISATLTAL